MFALINAPLLLNYCITEAGTCAHTHTEDSTHIKLASQHRIEKEARNTNHAYSHDVLSFMLRRQREGRQKKGKRI